MTARRARELESDPRHAQPYAPPDMRGRISHSDLWHRTLARWKPGRRVWVEFKR